MGLFIVWGMIALCGVMFYIIPTLVAYQRRQPNLLAITLLNLLLGWTIVGWVAALVWAVLVPQKKVVVRAVQRERDLM